MGEYAVHGSISEMGEYAVHGGIRETAGLPLSLLALFPLRALLPVLPAPGSRFLSRMRSGYGSFRGFQPRVVTIPRTPVDPSVLIELRGKSPEGLGLGPLFAHEKPTPGPPPECGICNLGFLHRGEVKLAGAMEKLIQCRGGNRKILRYPSPPAAGNPRIEVLGIDRPYPVVFFYHGSSRTGMSNGIRIPFPASLFVWPLSWREEECNPQGLR